jgi:type II secretory pathway predicted ATPase ExeA
MNKPHQAELDRPFPGVPVWQRYVGIGPIEEARQKICRMINRGEAIGVVMGPPGTGKTLLCHKIASLHRQSHEIVMLGDIRVTSRMGLIQQVLFHLGQPHLGKDEDALHLALVQTLAKSTGASRPLLLIIDEAQMLSAELLDEVRMMSNIVRDGRPMVQTLLVGGPRLEDALADPQAESLTQRIAVRCYLHPLTHGEADQYIRTSMSSMRLAVDDAAIASVHHASGGIPRLINQLMDLAIEIASTKRLTVVNELCVQVAWSELQQLPSPILESELKSRGGVIEFGDLDGATFDFENEKIEAASSTRTPMTSAEETVAANTATSPAMASPAPTSPARESATSYADIASILNSASIDCMSESTGAGSFGIWSDSLSAAAAENDVPPIKVELKTTRTTIPMHPIQPTQTLSAMDDKPFDDRLFGENFDDEMPVDLHAVNFSSLGADPASDELSLHDEILRLSKVATGAVEGDVRPNPSCDVPRELADALAVVWNDEDTDCDSIDDRDMLVIEEDVSVMIDTPESSFVASGAMRKPTLKVVQNYQSLFSRLRGQ